MWVLPHTGSILRPSLSNDGCGNDMTAWGYENEVITFGDAETTDATTSGEGRRR